MTKQQDLFPPGLLDQPPKTKQQELPPRPKGDKNLKKPEKEFVPLQFSETIDEALAYAATHTFRARNTNCEGGVLLGKDRVLNAPYYCAASILSTEQLRLEYTRNTGSLKSSKGEVLSIFWANLKALELLDDPEALEKRKKINSQIAEEIRRKTATPHKTQVVFSAQDQLPMHMAQLCLHDGSSFFVTTPIQSHDANAKVHLAVESHIRANREARKVDDSIAYIRGPLKVELPVGGANPHNPGRLTREAMTKGLFQEAPKSNTDTKYGKLIYHKGLMKSGPLFDSKAVLDYSKFRTQYEQTDQVIPSNSRVRETEQLLLQRISSLSFFTLRARAIQCMSEFTVFGKGGDFSPHLSNPVEAPFYNRALLQQGWANDFAEVLTERLLSLKRKITVNGEEKLSFVIKLDESSKRTLTNAFAAKLFELTKEL